MQRRTILAVALFALFALTQLAMPQTTHSFASSQSFPVNASIDPANAAYWTKTVAFPVPANMTGAIASFQAGPMPDAASHFLGIVVVDKGDGNGFVDVGVGLEGWGGMSSSTRGGPLDTPVTIFAQGINMPLHPGWQVAAWVHIEGPSAVIASVSATPY